ncbi:MAG TPA: GMC family oxidoreductase N-terminal domain-containing protein, partial [Chitinophagaceae bacterium]|nr:GMC family oxidoreductase N-terminal domain-containing protein [Chitinophagaceae bacterium]
MFPIVNLRGYTAADPLDKAPGWLRSLLMIVITGLLSVALMNHIIPSRVLLLVACLINCLLLASLVTAGRKSSSLIPFLIFFIPDLLVGMYLHSHGHGGVEAFPFIGVPLLQLMLGIAVYSILLGILPLFLARLIARVLYGKAGASEEPSKEEYESLFSKECSEETVMKPKRDAAFYLLRIIGFAYLIYLCILVIGLLGSAIWPESIRNLIDMTYANPALAINTYFKLALMIMLAFTGAYNKSLRFHSCLALFVGHMVSVAYSLAFYYIASLQAVDRDFLLLSALADGLMSLVFLWILIRYKKDAAPYARESDFPVGFSIPMTLTQYLYKALGILFLLTAIIILCIRVFTDGATGISAVFGNPDPMIGNTLILYSTLALIAFILAGHERLRPRLFHTLTIPLIFGGAVSLCWVLIGSMQGGIWIHTRQNTTTQVNWYFILHAVICFLITVLLTACRRMYFKVDYAINTVSPPAALNILALTSAFYGGDNKQQVSILQSVDQYIGGISGRKRGLLNLPFSLFENALNLVYGLHPPFSAMSREEQRYCLKKYFVRNGQECKSAMIPALAAFASQIGMSLNAIATFAYYSNLNAGSRIGYVPVDARDRTQGDTPAYPPPFKQIASLPKDAADPHNFKPVMGAGEGPVVAPRVTTPVMEPDIPGEVDYLIVGSGAGGATAAYRLACTVKDPSRILVVEQGNRYQPLQDFQDNEIEMMKKIYKEGGLQQTRQFTMTMMQGECVGGTTVTNNAVCFEMPETVKQNWQQTYDIDLSGLAGEYQQVEKDLNITPLEDAGVNQVVKEKFVKAVAAFNAPLPDQEKLDTHYPVLVNHINTMGDGNWNIGNKRMRKRSMLETYIPWSEARGVKVIANLTAVRFTSSDNRRADAVILRSDNGHLTRVKVRKAVLLAGGVLASSRLLMLSKVPNPYIGQNLSCNFAFPLTFEFNEEVNAFDGDQITLGALDPQGRSAFETYFNPPASFALTSVPFFFNRQASIMSRYKYMVNFGSLIGSEPNGTMQKKADLINGQAFTWTLGKKDVANIKYGFTTLLQLGRLAAAKRAILPTKPGIELDMTNASQVQRCITALEKFPLRMTD